LKTKDGDPESLETKKRIRREWRLAGQKDGDPESLETKKRIIREWRLAGQSKSSMWG